MVNIKEYINETDTPNLWKLFQQQPIYEAQMTSPDGNIYGLPHAEFDINNYVLMWNIIRQDWLDKLGLAMPSTIDEYHDVLVAFRDQDPNGNGKRMKCLLVIRMIRCLVCIPLRKPLGLIIQIFGQCQMMEWWPLI